MLGCPAEWHRARARACVLLCALSPLWRPPRRLHLTRSASYSIAPPARSFALPGIAPYRGAGSVLSPARGLIPPFPFPSVASRHRPTHPFLVFSARQGL
eukprot:596037-Pleurochrysis_carterae.AAC.1